MSIIASASNDLKLHQWPDGASEQIYLPGKFEEGHIRSLSWGKDGCWLVLVPYCGPAEVISIRDNLKLLQTIDEVQNPTCGSFQNSTKKNIALGTLSGQVLVYDIKARGVKKRFPRAGAMINQLVYNAKDTHLAASCDNGDILVYNCMTSSHSSAYRVPNSETVSTVNFHRSKRNLLGAGSDEGVVAAWDINTSSLLLEIRAHHAPTTALTFSPIRSDLLVTGGLDRRFTFYDILTKKCILEVEVLSSITAMDFSYCGTYLGLASQAGGVVLYDTRNLNMPLSAFSAHQGKKIRHLLFQKVVCGKDEDNNSIFEVMNEEMLQRGNASTNDSIETMIGDESNHFAGGEPNEIQSVQDPGDSFLMAMGCDYSSKTDSRLKNTGLGITEGVKQWMNNSKHLILHHTSLQHIPEPQTPELSSLLQMMSTPKFQSQSRDYNLLDQKSSKISCNVSSSSNEGSKFSSQDRLTEIKVICAPSKRAHSASTPKFPSGQDIMPSTVSPIVSSLAKEHNQACVSTEDLKEMIREVVREEISNQFETHKNEIKTEFADSLVHMRRHFLDLQMSIVKEFVTMESMLDKFNNVTVREYVCDDFLLNQNSKLIKELDGLREQMVEKDLVIKKYDK